MAEEPPNMSGLFEEINDKIARGELHCLTHSNRERAVQVRSFLHFLFLRYVETGNYAGVWKLLNQVDMNFLEPGVYVKSLFDVAFKNHQLRMAEFLYDVAGVQSNSQSLYKFAVRHKLPEYFTFLTERGFSIYDSNVLLIHAVRANSLEMLTLLSHSGVTTVTDSTVIGEALCGAALLRSMNLLISLCTRFTLSTSCEDMLPDSIASKHRSFLDVFSKAVHSGHYELLSFAKFFLKIRFTAVSTTDPCYRYFSLLERAVSDNNLTMFVFLLDTMKIRVDLDNDQSYVELLEKISEITNCRIRKLFWDTLIPRVSSEVLDTAKRANLIEDAEDTLDYCE